MNASFISTTRAPGEPDAPGLWFIFCGYDLLAKEAKEAGETTIPRLITPAELDLAPLRQLYLGYLSMADPGDSFVHCYAAEVERETTPPPGMAFEGLRALYTRLQNHEFWLAARAVQIVDWDRTHQFCSRCGTPTADQPDERVKKCPNCGLLSYPRLAPAVIVRVERTSPDGRRQMLLARNHRFPRGYFSVLAGFVEPGETLEECVRREVYEEANIRVENIRYFGSQPWPFPHSLMIAFVAEYAGGEIKVDGVELDEADWFAADNLPQVPPPLSVSRQLIDAFVAENTL
jgi:NAD+ diphosphatase